jgi:amino acid adenylation domain-containing protein
MLPEGLSATASDPGGQGRIDPRRPLPPGASFVAFARSEIEQSISRRFEAQVRQNGWRTAVSFGGRAIRYEELNRRSNRIGRAILSRRGQSPEAVALLLGQGVDLIAAILAVLKTGKFYVGLDVRRPRPSLQSLLGDCRAPLLLTADAQWDLAGSVAPPETVILNLDRIDPALSDDDLGLEVPPDALAYLFQTSGSTGRPKGVVDCHRNVLHNIMRYTNTLRIGPEDRLSLLQSPSFSGSVSSLFAALLNDACVCPLDLHSGSSEDLARWLQRERVTIYHSVPTIFRSFLVGDRVFSDVRVIRLEGDQAARLDVKLFRRHFGPGCVLVNGLGTTETGLVSQYFVRRDTEISGSVLPVGYAVDDMDVRVVGDDGRPVAHGEVGEIVVTSEYLAVGYENRPELTQERLGETYQAGRRRTYRTGDIGRMDPDGCLVHLGRKDSRVKIRGESVEPAQVEGAILDLACVRDAAVIPMKDRGGELRLVAYVVRAQRPGPTVSELRRGIAHSVPGSMIPSVWVPLEELPRNANGKIDRSALPLPRGERPDLDLPYAPAATPVQTRLAEIWEELLEVHPVGSRDDFFELGGDSLLAMRLLAQVERVFEVGLSPTTLLEASTVETLAGRIVRQGQHLQAPIVVLKSGGVRPPLVYVHGDYQSGGFYCISLARHLPPEQPLYVIAPCGLDGGPIPPTYGEMADIHLRALRELLPQGPYRLGGTCNGGLVAYEMARRLEALGQRVELLVLFGASAANLRFRRLARWTETLGGLLGLSPRARSEVFARLRAVTLHLDPMPRWKRGLYLPKKAGKISRELAGILGLRRGTGRRAEPLPGATDPTAERESIRDVYLKIDGEYFPGPYAGRVTLFWPSEDPEMPQEAADAWREVAREVELHVIPGTHTMGLAKNVRLLAEELERCLGALARGASP